MSHPNTRRWLIRLLQAAVLAIVAFFIYEAFADSWHEIQSRAAQLQIHWAWLVSAMAIYLLGLWPAAWFWKRVLQVLGQPQQALPLAAAYFVGNLGKYVPGKAMVVVLRVALLKDRRCTFRTAAASVFYETLTMMAIGGFLGAGIMAILFRDRWLYVMLALAMAVASLMPTLPPVFAWLLKRVGGSGKQNAESENSTAKPTDDSQQVSLGKLDTSVMLTGWLAHILGWIILGGSLWAVCQACDMQPAAAYSAWWLQAAVCIAATSLAMVAGFLSLIPAGALVRESMILAVLAPAYGESNAILAAIVLRLVWLVGDLVISGGLYATVRRREGMRD